MHKIVIYRDKTFDCVANTLQDGFTPQRKGQLRQENPKMALSDFFFKWIKLRMPSAENQRPIAYSPHAVQNSGAVLRIQKYKNNPPSGE